MAAYLVVYITVSNPEQIKKYQAVTPAAIAKYGGRFLVRGGPKVTVEGPEEQRRIGHRRRPAARLTGPGRRAWPR